MYMYEYNIQYINTYIYVHTLGASIQEIVISKDSDQRADIFSSARPLRIYGILAIIFTLKFILNLNVCFSLWFNFSSSALQWQIHDSFCEYD